MKGRIKFKKRTKTIKLIMIEHASYKPCLVVVEQIAPGVHPGNYLFGFIEFFKTIKFSKLKFPQILSIFSCFSR